MDIIVNSILSALVQFFLNGTSFLIQKIFSLIDYFSIVDSGQWGKKGDFILQIFPKLDDFIGDFRSIGYFIAFTLFVFGLFMMLFPYMDFEPPAQNPFQLVFRFGFSLLMISSFYAFFRDVIYNKLFVVMFKYFYDAVGISSKDHMNSFPGVVASILSGITTPTVLEIINSLMIVVFCIIFVIDAFKFLVFHLEKLFLTRFLLYTAPIFCGTLASKKQSQIFKNYINMLLVNLTTIVINVIFCGIVMDGLININNTASLTHISGLGNFVDCFKVYCCGLMLLTAVLKVGKKLSVYVSQLFGVSGMADSIRDGMGSVGSMALMMGRSVYRGVSHGGSGHGKSNNGGNKKATDTTGANLDNSTAKSLTKAIESLNKTMSSQSRNNKGGKSAKGKLDSNDWKSKGPETNGEKASDTQQLNDDQLNRDEGKPGSTEGYVNPTKDNADTQNRAADTNNISNGTDSKDSGKAVDTNNASSEITKENSNGQNNAAETKAVPNGYKNKADKGTEGNKDGKGNPENANKNATSTNSVNNKVGDQNVKAGGTEVQGTEIDAGSRDLNNQNNNNTNNGKNVAASETNQTSKVDGAKDFSSKSNRSHTTPSVNTSEKSVNPSSSKTNVTGGNSVNTQKGYAGKTSVSGNASNQKVNTGSNSVPKDTNKAGHNATGKAYNTGNANNESGTKVTTKNVSSKSSTSTKSTVKKVPDSSSKQHSQPNNVTRVANSSAKSTAFNTNPSTPKTKHKNK